MIAPANDRPRFLKPDFHDQSDPGGCPFRVDLRGLAEQRDLAESSSGAELWMELAENYMDYQMHDRAAGAFNRAREQGRDDFTIWHSLAMAYQFAGIIDGAIYAHEEALRREAPDEYWLGTSESLGVCLWKQGSTTGSLAMFRQAADRDPWNVMAWRSIHAACDLLGDIDAKAEAQQKLVSLCDRSNYHNTVALGYEELGEIGQAIGLYKEAIASSPYPVLPWHSLGKVYLSLSRLEDSAHAFELCLSCDAIPDRANLHAPAWTHLSYLYGVDGKYEESVNAANSALAYWESGTAHMNAGAARLALNDAAGARKHIQKGRFLRPDRAGSVAATPIS